MFYKFTETLTKKLIFLHMRGRGTVYVLSNYLKGSIIKLLVLISCQYIKSFLKYNPLKKVCFHVDISTSGGNGLNPILMPFRQKKGKQSLLKSIFCKILRITIPKVFMIGLKILTIITPWRGNSGLFFGGIFKRLQVDISRMSKLILRANGPFG